VLSKSVFTEAFDT